MAFYSGKTEQLNGYLLFGSLLELILVYKISKKLPSSCLVSIRNYYVSLIPWRKFYDSINAWDTLAMVKWTSKYSAVDVNIFWGKEGAFLCFQSIYHRSIELPSYLPNRWHWIKTCRSIYATDINSNINIHTIYEMQVSLYLLNTISNK